MVQVALNVLQIHSALFWMDGWIDTIGQVDGWVNWVNDAQFNDPATLGLSRSTTEYANQIKTLIYGSLMPILRVHSTQR